MRKPQGLRRREALAVAPGERNLRVGRPALRSLAPADTIERLLQPPRRVRILEQELQRQMIERPPCMRDQIEGPSGVVEIFLEPPGGDPRAAIGHADGDHRGVDRDLLLRGRLHARARRNVGTCGQGAGRSFSRLGRGQAGTQKGPTKDPQASNERWVHFGSPAKALRELRPSGLGTRSALGRKERAVETARSGRGDM